MLQFFRENVSLLEISQADSMWICVIKYVPPNTTIFTDQKERSGRISYDMKGAVYKCEEEKGEKEEENLTTYNEFISSGT